MTAQSASVSSLAALHTQLQNPPDDARIMMRWWWFGPSVVNQELEREMLAMKQGGIGGFEVQPVYPLALDDANIHNAPYLSPQFLDALRFTGATAKSLGLRMDLTLGSGWPYGGPHIPSDQAAGRLRIEKVKADRIMTPSLAGGEKLIAAFDVEGRELQPPYKSSSDVTFFISSRTGQQVKRPSVGAEGFVLDHYDRAAIENHLKVTGDKMLQALGPNTPYAVFCDSLEVYGSDWTGDFLAEFQKRRGYDLRPHLPKIAGGSGDDAVAIRSDWGRTLTELLDDRFFAPLQQWSKQHGTKLRAQAYGIPPASISTARQVDLPEGEGIQWKTLSQLRYITSAAHLLGRPVVSSETWTWLHSPVFRATPLDMKAEAHLHFLQGVNQLIGHGWPYTPPGVEYPGWRFYASGVYNEKNPWWIAMPDLAKYLQRTSFMLRQGKPANDVALYMPNDDAWGHFTPGRVDLRATLTERIGPDVIPTIMEAGYGFDCFDDGTVDQALRAKIIILPGVETIPVATLRKLDAFARAGGTVIATRRLPDKAPGFKATAAEHEEVRKLAARIALVKDDQAALVARLTAALAPDVHLAPEVGFVHRSTSGAEIYFVANTGNQTREFSATFRQQMPAEVWDPKTMHRDPGSAKITLSLEPYGSRFVIFSKEASNTKAAGKDARPTEDVDLSKDWKVTFGNETKNVATLRSWTDDEATRYFSGTATYEKEITVPVPAKGMAIDFGEGKAVPRTAGMGYRVEYEGPVREAAEVFVNGKRAGSVWCPPYRLEIGHLLQPGKNTLRVVVGNLAVNYMAGHRLPDYKLLNLRYTERFQAQDMDKIQPVPAGLLGPIRLTVGGN